MAQLQFGIIGRSEDIETLERYLADGEYNCSIKRNNMRATFEVAVVDLSISLYKAEDIAQNLIDIISGIIRLDKPDFTPITLYKFHTVLESDDGIALQTKVVCSASLPMEFQGCCKCADHSVHFLS